MEDAACRGCNQGETSPFFYVNRAWILRYAQNDAVFLLFSKLYPLSSKD